ncbi:hypothetical protein P43SY_008109 [Pythium insidiosum]|uniref:Apple domain-containing protein n=1 Tax=Pythium insidiosum TaxID=114742 RepID=A0AAD5M0G3_PYTIN|nr:hypothetical protein P43SY_008109 [Pythium insidiosum]KAJ0402750.1 hypothetical protein ATCC90586_007661 [Pythium insidiosum]
MTPIDPPGPARGASGGRSDETNAPTATEKKRNANNKKKKKSNSSTCVFQRFENSWMDAGGDLNDIMSQLVTSAAECEQLCCAHPKCQSYTFWMGNTCFLRATRNLPREEANSLSANKL